MLDQKTTGSYRWAKLSSTLCCVVTILCGILNLAAWGAHAADQTIAATLVLNGLAVLGIASGRSRIAKVCSASAAAVAALSVASFLFPPIREFAIPAGPAFCFGLLAISLLWPGNTGGQMSSSRLGIGGSLMVALSLGSVIELFSGTSHSFRSLIEMSLPIAVGCLFLGLGITGTAWDLSQPAVREPIWLPAGATLAVATVRFALWEALSDRKTHIFSIGTLMGGLTGAVLFGVVIHLGLKAMLTREVVRRTNRRLEEEIQERRRAEEAALDANRAKSAFLANMSHEIRTPMTGVLGIIDLVLSAEDLPSQRREHLQTARNAADSLLSLLNDILDLSKIEAGRLDLVPVVFSVRQCVADAVRMFEIRTREKGLELITRISPDVPGQLSGDALRLRQVLVNLVGNACKFTNAGQVTVAVELAKQTESEVTLAVRVADTGIGISAEHQQIIFDPFRQIDGSNTRLFGGTGLGLTISARLVQLMGGIIRVQSELGKGSTFSFVAPFACAKEPASAVQSLQAISSAINSGRKNTDASERCLRILLAEDNVVNQKVVAELLKTQGHEVEVVGNGREALEAIAADVFDLVLMDVQMPVMDGFEATAAIREKEKNNLRRTPIVALTARAMKGDHERCIEAGMDGYLSKPIDLPSLREKLRALRPMAGLNERDVAVSSQ